MQSWKGIAITKTHLRRDSPPPLSPRCPQASLSLYAPSFSPSSNATPFLVSSKSSRLRRRREMLASAPPQPPTTNLGFRRAVVSFEKRIGRSSVITPGSVRLRNPSPRLEAVSRGEEQCCDSTGMGNNNNLLSLCLASDGIDRSHGRKRDPNSIVGILQLRCIAIDKKNLFLVMV